MNTDHGDSLVLLARVFTGIESQEVVMTSVDRLMLVGPLGFEPRTNGFIGHCIPRTPSHCSSEYLFAQTKEDPPSIIEEGPI